MILSFEEAGLSWELSPLGLCGAGSINNCGVQGRDSHCGRATPSIQGSTMPRPQAGTEKETGEGPGLRSQAEKDGE